MLASLAPAWWDAWYGVLEHAFGGVAESPEERALWHDLTEFDRSIAVLDGDSDTETADESTKRFIGGSGAFSFRVAVPGAEKTDAPTSGAQDHEARPLLVPAAGITMVGVVPTHRRRGVLTAMMRRLLEDARERGEPLAVLTASEPAIYGRFGFGVATRQLRMRIPRHRVRIAPPAPGEVPPRLRPADPAAALPACEELHRRISSRRPGWIARPDGWERQALLDPVSLRDGASPLLCVLAEDPDGGTLRGYARYAVRPRWEWSGPQGEVAVREVQAADPAAYAALWRFLLDIDLTDTVEARNLPVDDPLLHLVDDERRCEPALRDSLHVRLVDVPAALAARRYNGPLDVVLEVADSFCPQNAGRWRLTADPDGTAVCERSTEPAELALSVRELGSVYLGGNSLAALAAAGRVTELAPGSGALARAAVAFAAPGGLAPWLPRGF